MSYSKTAVESSYWGNSSTIIDINSVKSIMAILVLSVIGPCMFILQPGYVQGLIQYMGYTDGQAGLIASAEMFGVALTAIGVNFILNKVNWRILIFVFLVLAGAGNFLSILMNDATSLMVMRFITGLGSGGIMVFSFTMMGLTERADRNMGLMVVALLVYGALGLLVMPTVFGLVGVEGLLVFFGFFCLSGLLIVKNLPCSHQDHEEVAANQKTYPRSTKLITLMGVLCYNIAIGLVWVYIFVVGVDAGISEQVVANGLTASQFFGILGASMAILFEGRYGRFLPLSIGVIGGAAGIGLLIGVPSAISFIVGVCVFNALWNLTLPYLMALLSDFDNRGGMVTLGITLQFVGFAIGPALATSLLDVGGFDLINSIAIALFIVSVILLLPGIRALKSKVCPSIKAKSVV
ncbi:MFS transporter [Pseudocolwellia sp. HL-MZ19]|uniref:MFS transporter n=1 Tax=Pseudocolwellia sp. HL-MZ19 TaxID=3400846 RepID=UPI003CEBEF0D